MYRDTTQVQLWYRSILPQLHEGGILIHTLHHRYVYNLPPETARNGLQTYSEFVFPFDHLPKDQPPVLPTSEMCAQAESNN